MMTRSRRAIGLFALAVGCGQPDGERIIDIGKGCDEARDCEHVCIHEVGEATGYCSIECLEPDDCPRDSDCIVSGLTGEQRCWPWEGSVGADQLCANQCFNVDYFCSTSEIGAADVDRCVDWCWNASDSEIEDFRACVAADPRYTSACPAADCVIGVVAR